MKHLINLKYNLQDVIIKPILKDGKMINIDIIFDRYKISFRDSLLILLASLKKLSKAFNVDDKGVFDYKSVDNLNVLQLNDKLLRGNIISYAQLDCKILYLILIKFNSLIFELYSLNVNRFPTLPSLAIGIFRSKYLQDKTVPNITGQAYLDLKESYTGGSTDVIVPHGENLFYYDVNSLYPLSMLSYPVPIGNMKAFEGDITKIDPFAFGFFEVEIFAPINLHVPVLQIHYKGRTISPVGNFRGWFLSEELRNAVDHFGYKIEILRG
jgi:DNA polymerase type B, organellar and viral